MEKSNSIKTLIEALTKMQGAMESIPFDKTNSFFNGSRYASLTSIANSIRKPLADNGLAVVQATEMDAEGPFLETVLFHTCGEFIASKMRLILPQNKRDMQGMGSALTYARRYSLGSILGLVSEEDDDANAVMMDADTKNKKQKPQQGNGHKKETPAQAVNEGSVIKESIVELRRTLHRFGWTGKDAMTHTHEKYKKLSGNELTEKEIEEFQNFIISNPKNLVSDEADPIDGAVSPLSSGANVGYSN